MSHSTWVGGGGGGCFVGVAHINFYPERVPKVVPINTGLIS